MGQLYNGKYRFLHQRIIVVTAILFLFSPYIFAQDDTRVIVILPGSQSLRQITVDSSTTIISLAGNARVRQGNTLISGDSIAVNQATSVAEVFGHVHINDADTVDTYSNYLRYLGTERIAYLKKNVKLTDGRGTLLTDDLEYNLGTGIAKYRNGGRVLNGKTVLTSAEAVYYSDTKDVYFQKYVHLTDPIYDIKADSLLYNTQRKEARFIAPTRIKTKDGGTTNTSNGFYNLETGEAEFYDRTSYSDSSYFVIGDKIAYVKDKGILQIDGRGKIVDSANNVTMIGDLLFLDKINKTFLGTRKPVLIIYRGSDSTYVAADTLFSGVRLRRKDEIINEGDSTKATDSVKINLGENNAVDPRFENVLREATAEANENKPAAPRVKDSVRIVDSTLKKPSNKNLKGKALNADSVVNKPVASDSVRYFLGFRNVRIFNDSLQAVSDSMYYSTEDSVFRMYRNPVFWNDKSQVAGDTMYLFTENKKPKRLYVFNNAIIINKENEAMYNQVGGRTLNGYFIDGNLDYVRVKGSPAESIFYPQDDDSAYIGMNRSTSDVIDAYFIEKKLNKIKFVNDVDGVLYPLRMVTEDKKSLKNFLWQDKRRPKNKLELFE